MNMLVSRKDIKQPLSPLRIKKRLSRFLGKGLTASSAASPNSNAEIFHEENSVVTLTTLPTLPLSVAISSSRDSVASSVNLPSKNDDNDIISKICICLQDVCVCTPLEPEQPPQPVKLEPLVCKDHTCVCFNQICKCATPLCVCCTIDENAQKVHDKPYSYRPFVSLGTLNEETDAKGIIAEETDAKNVEPLSSLFVPFEDRALDTASLKDSKTYEDPSSLNKKFEYKPHEASSIHFSKAFKDFKDAIKRGLEKSYKYKLKVQFKIHSLRRTKTSSLSWFKRRRDHLQGSPSSEASMPLCCRRYDIAPAPVNLSELEKRNYYHEQYLSRQKASDYNGASYLKVVIMRAKMKSSASQIRKIHAKSSTPKFSSHGKSLHRKNLPFVVGHYYTFKNSPVRPASLISPLVPREETVDEKLARLLAEFARHRSFAAIKAYKFELRIRNRRKDKPSTTQEEHPAVRLPLISSSIQHKTKPSKKGESKNQNCQDAINMIEEYAQEMGMLLTTPELKVRMNADSKDKNVSPLRNLNKLKDPTLNGIDIPRMEPGHYSFVRIRSTSKSGETRSAMIVRKDNVGDRKFSSVFRDCIERIDKVPETQSTMSVDSNRGKNETQKETGKQINSILSAIESMHRATPNENSMKSKGCGLQPGSGSLEMAANSRSKKVLKKVHRVEERAFEHDDKVQEASCEISTKHRAENRKVVSFKDCSPVTKKVLKESSVLNKSSSTLQHLGTKSLGSISDIAKC